MSKYQPKSGERVRIAYEVTVGRVEGDLIYAAGGRAFSYYDSEGCAVSVTKVTTPIPTAPGTVLLVAGVAWQRAGREWSSTAGGVGWWDADMERHADRHGFTVLRDGSES